MARLTLKQKQEIFDRKSEPIADLVAEFKVSASVICQHQKVRAKRKNGSTRKDKAKQLSLYSPEVSFTIEDIIEDNVMLKHRLIIKANIKPLTGTAYEQLRHNIQVVLKPFTFKRFGE